jgi:hypothetical protein
MQSKVGAESGLIIQQGFAVAMKKPLVFAAAAEALHLEKMRG